MRSSLIIGASVATVIAAGASADITGAFTVDYTTTVKKTSVAPWSPSTFPIST